MLSVDMQDQRAETPELGIHYRFSDHLTARVAMKVATLEGLTITIRRPTYVATATFEWVSSTLGRIRICTLLVRNLNAARSPGACSILPAVEYCQGQPCWPLSGAVPFALRLNESALSDGGT
jgi:hypothetical protein